MVYLCVALLQTALENSFMSQWDQAFKNSRLYKNNKATGSLQHTEQTEVFFLHFNSITLKKSCTVLTYDAAEQL